MCLVLVTGFALRLRSDHVSTATAGGGRLHQSSDVATIQLDRFHLTALHTPSAYRAPIPSAEDMQTQALSAVTTSVCCFEKLKSPSLRVAHIVYGPSQVGPQFRRCLLGQALTTLFVMFPCVLFVFDFSLSIPQALTIEGRRTSFTFIDNAPAVTHVETILVIFIKLDTAHLRHRRSAGLSPAGPPSVAFIFPPSPF